MQVNFHIGGQNNHVPTFELSVSIKVVSAVRYSGALSPTIVSGNILAFRMDFPSLVYVIEAKKKLNYFL